MRQALRPFPEGHFCVRQSTSTADCHVLSLMGPTNVVYHYQLKKINGRVQIYPGRTTVDEPTFATHAECLQHYLAADTATTGLATKPAVCIPLDSGARTIDHSAGAPVDC